jgi:hypothetical protein
LTWLTKDRRDWLSGRYLSVAWFVITREKPQMLVYPFADPFTVRCDRDVDELTAMKDEIVDKDLLKFTMDN